MTDPTRLVNGDPGFERDVLASWQERQPSEAARLKTLGALGAGGVLLAAGGSVAGSVGASMAPKAIVVSSLVKWLSLGAGVVAIAGATGYATYRGRAVDAAPSSGLVQRAPASPSPAPRSVAAPAPPRDTAAAAPVDRPPPASPLPAETQAGVGPAQAGPVVRTVVPPPATPSSLDEEVLAIDRARGALVAGDTDGALQLVDAYDARYPGGALTQESAEIRVEALLRSGRRAMGEKAAARFLSTYPASPYARVIRGLLGGAAPASP